MIASRLRHQFALLVLCSSSSTRCTGTRYESPNRHQTLLPSSQKSFFTTREDRTGNLILAGADSNHVDATQHSTRIPNPPAIQNRTPWHKKTLNPGSLRPRNAYVLAHNLWEVRGAGGGARRIPSSMPCEFSFLLSIQIPSS